MRIRATDRTAPMERVAVRRLGDVEDEIGRICCCSSSKHEHSWAIARDGLWSRGWHIRTWVPWRLARAPGDGRAKQLRVMTGALGEVDLEEDRKRR